MRNFRDLFLIFVLFVISLVDAFAECVSGQWNIFYRSGSQSCSNGPGNCWYDLCSSVHPSCTGFCGGVKQEGSLYYAGLMRPSWCTNESFCSSASQRYECVATVRCETRTEADSVQCLLNGNLWIEGSCCDEQCACERDGGRWENGHCNPACNDHVPVPDKCEEVFRNGYGMDGGYWAIQTYECYFDSCAMSLNCTEKSQFPAGNLTCDDFQDTTETPGRCVGVVGHTCTMQCPGNITKTCDCDGSCSHAMTLPQCQCQSSSSQPPQSSSSGQNQSSDSQSSDSQSSDSQSSDSQPPTPGSSSSVGPGVDGDWEYDYRNVLDSIKRNTGSTVGYLSSIDKRISSQNLLIQESTNRIVSATEAAGASATTAIGGATDTLHRTNEILTGIASGVGTLDSNVDVPDISQWQLSADSLINKLQHPDTAIVKVDSLKNDTSTFKTKYGDFFLKNVYTRDGCYEFRMKKPEQNSRFGRLFSSDIVVDFGSLGGFDFCAILRGLCRIAGAVLVLLISIKSYRSAFSSSDG